MKPFTKFLALFSGLLATTALAAGFDQLASKLDPVSQKAHAISALDDAARPDDPCIACVADPE